jgi:hypothetical protein
VVVEWETASELETVGFNIYRSENPYEGYEKVNKIIIPTREIHWGSILFRIVRCALSAGIIIPWRMLMPKELESVWTIQVDWVGWIELSLAAILLVVGASAWRSSLHRKGNEVRAGGEGRR